MQVRSCKAKTRSGARCQANAGRGGYCYFHSPAHARDRARAHRLGGLRRIIPKVAGECVAIKDAASLLELLNKITLDTWQLENSAARSRAVLAAIDTGAKVLQVGELEERIAALEEIIAAERHIR